MSKRLYLIPNNEIFFFVFPLLAFLSSVVDTGDMGICHLNPSNISNFKPLKIVSRYHIGCSLWLETKVCSPSTNTYHRFR